MKHTFVRFAVGVLALCCCLASAQQAPPQDTSPALNETNKRTVAQITKLQQRIERLDNEIESRQAKIETLADTLPASVRNSLLAPKVAKVLNINGQTIIITAGIRGNGFRNDDKLIYARREMLGIRLIGKGRVMRSYPNDAECDVTEDIVGIVPGDEVYISNRSGSPYSINRVRF